MRLLMFIALGLVALALAACATTTTTMPSGALGESGSESQSSTRTSGPNEAGDEGPSLPGVTPREAASPEVDAPPSDNGGEIPDPATREAEGYAAHVGVSLEEAQHRLKLQRLAGDLEAELTEHEGQTFRGLWIEHTPQFRVIVQFTQDAQETVARYIQGDELAEVLEVRTADVSLAELREAQSEAMEAIRSASIPVESGIDIKAGRVKIYVAERDRLDDAIQRGDVTLPDKVDLVTVPAMGQLDGELLTNPHSGLDESPLASWDPSSYDVFTDRGGPEGTIDISTGCVRLIREDGQSVLLVWPEPTSWDASSQVIEFEDVRGEPLQLSHGDRIRTGGGFPSNPRYVIPPDPSCQADRVFRVNSARLVED